MTAQQLVTQQVKRTSYPKKKIDTLQKIAELASKYDTVIVTKLFKVRASQLMLLRKNYRSELVMIIAKNKIASLALKNSGMKNYDEFASKLDGPNALIFTNMNPFKLYLSLEKSKINLPARAGDIASDDIVVPAGNTGIAPGPVLSEFKEANVSTRIESGSIYVSKDSVVAHPGNVISPKLAGLLSRLNLKPIKAGLSIFMASSGGLLLLQKDITIDLTQYRQDIARAAAQAMGLAIEAVYTVPETMPGLISKALRSANEVAKESGYITADNAEIVLGYAEAQAKSVLDAVSKKGYKVE
ncbi:MAG: 50S ribosomal protein L10 [Thaumarchaeota archaeon]|nr:50S ribosomal protein L10 [Nitrososphaerota archaeon]